MKFALAITDKGEVLSASTDAAKVIADYKRWDGPGQAWLCERVHFDRVKRLTKTAEILVTKPTKRPMKNLSIAILFALSLFSASAQQVTVLDGGTNNVAAASGNTYSYYLDVSKQDNVAVSFRYRNNTALTASNAIVRFQRAGDTSGTLDDTVNTATMTLASSGTNWVTMTTNIAVTGVPYLKLVAIENTNIVAAHYLTNVSLHYTVKQLSRP